MEQERFIKGTGIYPQEKDWALFKMISYPGDFINSSTKVCQF